MRLEYFTAPWCVPCKVFGPTMDEVTTRLNVPVTKINIEENPELLPADVLGVPTVIMYDDNGEVSRIVGARGFGDLMEWINSGGN